MSTMSATVDNLFGTTPLEGTQAALIKKTYALLTVSLVTAVGGGYIGATSLPLVQFFASPIGWLMAMIMINAVPRIALWASTKNPTLAMLALAADGFLSGIALAPLLWLATYMAPDGHLIPAALGVTGAVFVSVTGYMLTTKQVFSAPRGLMTGMFFALIAAMGLNMFLGLSALATVISIGVGIFGVLMLVYATSTVLKDPEYDNPIQGALMLFAALFNIFVSALRLMMRFYSRD
ncbi:MAG: Bax inhibitor-1 family protein [Deltaproteobacteria bacterium]|jgi:modulator of FtsH protease|nr:Bax inhibitor-1 family protein [Deltaproteobacteria bacterium]